MDDAALSLGAALLAGSLGDRPTIVNVFSISNYTVDLLDAGDVEAVTELRKTEEKRACEIMGAGAVFLDFAEIQIRGLLTVHELTKKKYKPSRDPIYDTVAKSLREFLKDVASAVVIFPLGLGGHGEHRLLSRIGHDFSDRNVATVAFYEDVPYAGMMTVRDIEHAAAGLDRALVPFAAPGADIEEKMALLRIYESQIRDKELDMVRQYHKLRGDEHLWATRSAIDGIRSLGKTRRPRPS